MLLHHYLACELSFVHPIHLVDVAEPISHPAFGTTQWFSEGSWVEKSSPPWLSLSSNLKKVPIRAFCGHLN